ncbi:MAG: choice-of-anchor D domain-containing protein [Balneola sp.]
MISIRFFLSFTVVLLFLSASATAQLFEDFDGGSKGSYVGSSVTLASGNWFLDEALLGSLDNDKYNGSQSVRVREGSIYMEFDKQGGADELSFLLANYGNETGGKLQVQYSVDQGSSWTNIGNEYTATSSLEMITILINIDEPIRFKFTQSGGSGRLNLDDVRITDFINPAPEATIRVSVDEKTTTNETSINFGLITTNSTISKVLKIQNVGVPGLQISDVSVSGEGFTISDLQKSTLAFKEETEITISFNPTNTGEYSGELSITSNSASSPTFTLNLSGNNFTKDQTFDVVTWNIEWFGDTSNGPDNDDLQLQNVVEIIKTIDADIYALQEIASPVRFEQLVESLDDYGGFLADFSQTQETAFLFKRNVIDSLSGVTMSSSDGLTYNFWASGRYPLAFNFIADIGGSEQEFFVYNIHAKAFGDQSSYERRLNASTELKEYLDNQRANDNVIVLGDYNDEILSSTSTGNPSPYKNFDDDVEYTIITKNLEEQGLPSQTSYSSFLDHITFTSELSDEYIVGSENVDVPNYIDNYSTTTSDHYPVWTRFKFGITTSNDELVSEIPSSITLDQNYPNPFNPSTIISYTLDSSTSVKLDIYDITGRKVANLVDRRETAGTKEVVFDAGKLASGVYIYRLQTENGFSSVKKMVLIK